MSLLRYTMRPDVGAQLDRLGITRQSLATACGIDRAGMAHRLNETPPRMTRGVTAWRIAKGLAALTSMSDQEAFELLWDTVDTSPKVQPLELAA